MNDPASTPSKLERHLLSRLLFLIWCVWLLGNWLIHSRMESWIGPPTIRWLLLSALLGLLLIWPAVRLTDSTPHQGIWQTIGDLVGLLVIFQVIVLRLLLEWSDGSVVRNSWSLPRALLIDGVVMTWALVAAMWIDLGRRCVSVGRSLAMLACVCSAFGGSMLVGVPSPWTMVVGPIRSLWQLTGSTDVIDPQPVVNRLAVLAAFVVAIWVIGARLLGRRADRTCPRGRWA